MGDGLSIRTVLDNHRVRVVPSGTLDVSTSQRLTDELDGLLAEGRPIHVDLAQLDFLDSTGIAALMKAAQTARGSLLQLTFGPGTGQVQSALDLVRAERFLMFAGDRAEERG